MEAMTLISASYRTVTNCLIRRLRSAAPARFTIICMAVPSVSVMPVRYQALGGVLNLPGQLQHAGGTARRVADTPRPSTVAALR